MLQKIVESFLMADRFESMSPSELGLVLLFKISMISVINYLQTSQFETPSYILKNKITRNLFTFIMTFVDFGLQKGVIYCFFDKFWMIHVVLDGNILFPQKHYSLTLDTTSQSYTWSVLSFISCFWFMIILSLILFLSTFSWKHDWYITSNWGPQGS